MDIPNCFYRVSAKGLIFDNENRFLMCLDERGFWCLPGGGINFGEDAEIALQREIKEEMGLKVTNVENNPRIVVTAKGSKGFWYLDLVYKITTENLDVTHSKECVEFKFFTKKEALKLNLYPNIKEAIKQMNEK